MEVEGAEVALLTVELVAEVEAVESAEVGAEVVSSEEQQRLAAAAVAQQEAQAVQARAGQAEQEE